MAWNKTIPTSSSYVYDLGSIFSDNQIALDAFLSNEHYPLTSSVSAARHSPGKVSVVYQGTTGQLNALSATATSGALALDKSLGEMKVWTTSWQPVHQFYRDAYTLGIGSTYTVPGATWATVPFSGNRVLQLDKDQGDGRGLDSTYGWVTVTDIGLFLACATLDLRCTVPAGKTGNITVFFTSGNALPTYFDYYSTSSSFFVSNSTGASVEYTHRCSLSALLPMTMSTGNTFSLEVIASYDPAYNSTGVWTFSATHSLFSICRIA